MKLAGILQTQDYTDRYLTIRVLRQLCDCVIVLDDNSTKTDALQECSTEIDVLITMKNNQGWNCQANQTALMYQAWVNHCDWVLKLDDDMILSNALWNSNNVRRIVATAAANKDDMVMTEMRELWDNHETYRDDGKWNSIYPLFQRVWIGDSAITIKNPEIHRFHSPCFPANMTPKIGRAWNPYIVYHTGLMTKEDRERRHQRYMNYDPEGELNNYAYLMSEEGLVTKPVLPIEDIWKYDTLPR